MAACAAEETLPAIALTLFEHAPPESIWQTD